MTTYILRRLLASLLILLGASFIVYLLIAYSGDPLAEIRSSNSPSKAAQMQQRTELLHLDVPPALRYFIWLGGAVKCVVPFAGQCDLGVTLQNQPVTAALSSAIPTTLQLVTTAALLAIVLGVTIGVITALRQYSTLDYGVTFVTFLFFSLPVFWVAVLLKEFGAIGFNDFLRDPFIGNATIVVIALVVGLLWTVIIAGPLKRRLLTFGTAFVVTAAVLYYLSVTRWFTTPSLGLVVIGVTGIAAAYGFTVLFAGLQNRKALYSSLISVAIGLVAYVALQPLLDKATLWLVVLLGVVAVGAGILVGYLMGGYDRGQSMKAAGLTSFAVAALVLLDRFMQAWPAYMDNPRIRNRPVATIGAETPGLEGDFWIQGLDKYTHLILPTIALILISLASYTRYSRASMLEVMGQDYVRTARAKGLSERVVVTRHAFRNAMIPLATIVAIDIGSLIGGAVITENVFSFKGMGQLFLTGLRNTDPNPVMGVFLVTGITAVMFNLLADLTYSALDPRVRVKA
ncbi:ABC transporter permease [Cellulomonas fengjieae]|uniref:ABC transporter permease n=1 Tax=Cellulomonas fengjieae TaxID=2819978 RepID=A0ABS3SMB4_9CELL|nr:ABC transporter permease [Cellulomonas fengjieae]MBO3086464.1 ABC transporter permease [Cellulomonas fengjieae]MBO3100459.1 ABC transporter permease [Cellulomonas fengjieae]QVI66672.1 ABC transporter permease [Cellulomonas fengjieae]